MSKGLCGFVAALTANAALVSSCGSNATGGAHRRIRGRGGEIGGAKRDSSTIVCVRPLSTVVYLAAVMTAGLMLGDRTMTNSARSADVGTAEGDKLRHVFFEVLTTLLTRTYVRTTTTATMS